MLQPISDIAQAVQASYGNVWNQVTVMRSMRRLGLAGK
jgi:hypothetical protein